MVSLLYLRRLSTCHGIWSQFLSTNYQCQWCLRLRLDLEWSQTTSSLWSPQYHLQSEPWLEPQLLHSLWDWLRFFDHWWKISVLVLQSHCFKTSKSSSWVPTCENHLRLSSTSHLLFVDADTESRDQTVCLIYVHSNTSSGITTWKLMVWLCSFCLCDSNNWL
jgi:hypothetical protein